MPTYPLAFPSVSVVDSTFGIVSSSASSRSPFTYTEQIQQNAGMRFEGTVKFRLTKTTDAGILKAFLAELQGRYGTFLYGDPDYLAKGPQGALGGTPLVNGGSQTGNTLNIDGCSNSITGWAKRGDYIQLGTGTASRLYMITQDADSNGSGQVALKIMPALRSSPSDNAAVTVTGAKGLFRMASNRADWSGNKSSIHDVDFSFVEAISE